MMLFTGFALTSAFYSASVASFLHNPTSFRTYSYRTLSSSPSPFALASTTSSSPSEKTTDIFTLTVALTREEGKNDKIMKSIEKHPTRQMLKDSMKLQLIEMPCIEHADGPDLATFQKMARDDPSFSKYDYIVITSPESAKVFGSSVAATSGLSAHIAAVGKATKKALTDLGFQVSFVPSKANGETLAEELPPRTSSNDNNAVLYPASAKAADTIQNNLQSRTDATFTVTRLDTYDTIPATLSDEQLSIVLNDAQIACFGSPSAVDSWLANVDRALGIDRLDEEERKKTPGCHGNVVAVCIGATTARRCLESGRWVASDIYYPVRNPGLEGWSDSCLAASGDVMERVFWS